jgi:hypothetical protein
VAVCCVTEFPNASSPSEWSTLKNDSADERDLKMTADDPEDEGGTFL